MDKIVITISEYIHHLLNEFSADEINCVISSIQAGINLLLLILTLVSVVCAFLAYKHQKLRGRKEASCNLAKVYAEDIVGRVCFINHVLEPSGYAEHVKSSVPFNKIEKFDMAEFKHLAQDYSAIQTRLNELDPVIIYGARIATAKSIDERHTLASEYSPMRQNKDDPSSKIVVAHPDLLISGFDQDMIDLMNKLEWFSMNFQYKIADEAILYQSLHQTFLSTVWLLYPYICGVNREGQAKYFTNTIWLFNLWRNRLHKLQKKALKEQKNRDRELEILKQQLDQAQRCRNEIPTYTGKPL